MVLNFVTIAGHLAVHRNSGDNWTEIGSDINGNSEEDLF